MLDRNCVTAYVSLGGMFALSSEFVEIRLDPVASRDRVVIAYITSFINKSKPRLEEVKMRQFRRLSVEVSRSTTLHRERLSE